MQVPRSIFGGSAPEIQIVIGQVAEGEPQELLARVVCICGELLAEHMIPDVDLSMGAKVAALEAQERYLRAYNTLKPEMYCLNCGRAFDC
jgi:hypothetical protein